ncbi:MAG: hypothetical protein KJ559_02735 [Nanoarchaeota archaeon]|nr:hypothetical protein [Nanoarchaeota archaeon]
MIKGKRGGEKYLSIWWFFVLVIITGGIVSAVVAFNIADINVKEIESNILILRVVDCVIEQGYINSEFLKPDFDLFKQCNLNKEIIDKSEKLALSYSIFDLKNCKLQNNVLECNNALVEEKFGVSDFETQCKLKKKIIGAKHYPDCSEKFVYVLGENKEKLILHVFAGSNQEAKKEAIIK